MSFFDNLLHKMKMVPEEEEYDEYDDGEEEDEEEEDKKPSLKDRLKSRKEQRQKEAEYEDEDEDDDVPAESLYSNSGKTRESVKPAETYRENVRVLNVKQSSGKTGSPEVCMIMPRSFDDATTIADMLLDYKAVVLNMEGIDMAAAQRLIDFASGACYTVGGNLQKISKKIFMIVPQSMNLSGDFDDLVGDMVDLNSMNSAR